MANASPTPNGSGSAGKPRLLDLYAGAGGCTKGYQRAGFHVTGVDIESQPNYCGDDFVRADALTFLRGLAGDWEPATAYFDAVAASPPCQHYSTMGKDTNPALIEPTRELLEQTGLPYVIENIEDARPFLRDPVLICGTMFDPLLNGLKRHRLFETNWSYGGLPWPCRHKLAAPRFRVYEHGHWYLSPFVKVYGSGGGKAAEHWAEAMQIDWMTRDELKEAVPPAYTEAIGNALLAHIKAEANAEANNPDLLSTPTEAVQR